MNKHKVTLAHCDGYDAANTANIIERAPCFTARKNKEPLHSAERHASLLFPLGDRSLKADDALVWKTRDSTVSCYIRTRPNAAIGRIL